MSRSVERQPNEKPGVPSAKEREAAKLRLANQRDQGVTPKVDVEALPYAIPALVASYARCGSNFLQNVLQKSTGLSNRSIYRRSKKTEPGEGVLTVKSHALTPEFMLVEWQRKVDVLPRPERIVLLQRDPRDTIISFLSYAIANGRDDLTQENFLDATGSFHLDPETSGYPRVNEKVRMTFLESYQMYIRHWFMERPQDLNCHIVRYEDLVNEPRVAFQGVFDFMNLDCALTEDALGEKVSQYSSESGPRGVAQRWVQQADENRVLIERVHETLSEEITQLGYVLP